MGTRIVHFGADECARVILLSGMGYSVNTCGPSLRRLRQALSDECDAIAVEGSDPGSPDAVKLAREISAAPVVFFEGLATDYKPSEFDLVVRSHTPPDDWLRWLAQLIAETHVIRSKSQMLREQSASIRQDAEGLRQQARATRSQAADLLKSIRSSEEKD